MPVTVDPTGTPDDFSWHDSYIAVEPDSVPDIINTTTDLVRDMLEEARDNSDDAIQDARIAIEALSEAQLPEMLPEPPDAPAIITSFSATIGFSTDVLPELGTLSPQQVAAFTLDDIEVPDITGDLEDYVPVIDGLSFPVAPVLPVLVAPQAPGIDVTVDIPDRPDANYGNVPDLIELNLPVYVAPVLPTFNDEAPEFTDEAPDPFIQWQEPEYTSEIKTAVADVLLTMLAGGTGLPDDIERGIWERARGRLDKASLKKIEQARAAFAANGHEFPGGFLNAQMLALLDDSELQASDQSMQVAIEQAKLEQQNRQFAVERGIGYEQVFVNLFLAIVDRNFQIAKFAVEVQIQVFNSKVAVFVARNTAFMAKIEQYKAELEVAFAYFRAFEIQIKAEIAKGEINAQRLAVYTARIQAYNAEVDAFKTLVQAEGIRVDLEKAKIEVYRGEIDAYVGQINGQRASYEAYSTRVQAEAAKAGLEEANARAYVAKVQGVAAKAEIALKRADVQVQQNRLQLEHSVANIQRITQYTNNQLSAIQAKQASYEAGTRRAAAKFDADRSLKATELQVVIESNRNVISKYQASLEAWKTQGTQILAIAGMNAESLRAAAQIAGTLAAGAMAGTSVSAGVSGSAGASQAKQDSTSRGRTFNQSLSDSSSYNVNHTYNHET